MGVDRRAHLNPLAELSQTGVTDLIFDLNISAIVGTVERDAFVVRNFAVFDGDYLVDLKALSASSWTPEGDIN